MKFTEEHKSLAETVKDFSQNEIKPFIEEWEENGCLLYTSPSPRDRG